MSSRHLEELWSVRSTLPTDLQDAFNSYLIGALSPYVDADDWDDALVVALQCVNQEQEAS